MILQEEYNLNLESQLSKKYVKVSQYDTGRRLLITLLKNDCSMFKIPSEASASINGLKPDGKGFRYDCSIENNKVVVDMKEQMTVLAGYVKCEILLSKGGERIATANFMLSVEESPLSENTPISSTDIPLLQKAIEASETVLSVEKTVKGYSESASKSSQSAQKYAESASNASASSAESATNSSQSAQASVESANSASQSATNAQASAESASTSATTASTKATEASISATKAKESETNAKLSETNASQSATNAQASAESAIQTKTEIETLKTSVEASEENARKSELNAKASEEKSAESESNSKTFYDMIVATQFPYNLEGFSQLEKEITTRYEKARNGKVYATRFKKYEIDTSALGEYYMDSVGMVCKPSTDTVEGQDDFLNLSPFQWDRCNYVRDDDSVARVTALKGRSGYKEEGAVDVGTIMPTFWWKQEIGETYNTIYLSDSPHAELGLVPWYEAVKADGSVLPYYIGSAFPSVNASDGKLRSQPNLTPAYNQSHNGNCTEYQKKGAGYNGGGSETNLFALIMCAIKYRTMNVDYFSKGCTQFNTQVKCAVAETNVKRVLLSNKENFYEGCCVSVGVARTSDNSTDRGTTEMNSKANRVRVKSIEEVTVSDTKYYALNLDTDTSFDTDTTTYVSSMPCFAGETERVIGKHDGAYLSNTDGLHTLRICGREFLWGQGCIFCATALKLDNNAWHVMKAPKGVKANSSLTGYVDSGSQYDYNNGKDTYQGDLNLNTQFGTYAMRTKGSSSSLGVGDFIWEGGTGLTDGETREFYSGGLLWNRSSAGIASVSCWYWLVGADWSCGSRD